MMQYFKGRHALIPPSWLIIVLGLIAWQLLHIVIRQYHQSLTRITKG